MLNLESYSRGAVQPYGERAYCKANACKAKDLLEAAKFEEEERAKGYMVSFWHNGEMCYDPDDEDRYANMKYTTPLIEIVTKIFNGEWQ